jgi:uncharacterized protein DUF3551
MTTAVLRAMGIPAAALAAAITLGALFAPSAARAGEYCSVDDSYMWSCGFSSMEQCHATASGMNGSCTTNPFLKNDSTATINRNAYAYARLSVHHARIGKHPAPAGALRESFPADAR